jgi:hypothetical protein
MNTTATIVILWIGLAAIGAILWMLWNGRRKRLRKRFGPEYDRTISAYGSRRQAEQELLRREKRFEKFQIRPLAQAEQDRFAHAWRWDQSHFVDHPEEAVEEAQHLVTELMRARGYPVSDFEQQAADLSVEHSRVVQNYRAAHALCDLHLRGEASTEDLRAAMVHYRELFEELLERRVAPWSEMQSTERTR